MKKPSIIFLSGLLWLVIGFFLFSKGVNLIIGALSAIEEDHFSFIQSFSPFLGPMFSALVLVALGLSIGYVKGRYVLMKTVKRVVKRILSLSDPVKLIKVYSWSYIFLILGMVGLGLSFKYMPISADVRGTIDLAIGAALMNGSLLYFRFAVAAKRQV